MSALPDQLIAKKQQSQSPQQVLESIMSKRGMATTLYAYDQVSFFEALREEEINAYDFDVLKAIRTGDIEELRRFHESGRPLKCSNKFGESLLHLACRRALVPVVDFLLNEAGVTVQVVDDMGRSPLHDAFWTCEPNFELVDLILNQCPDLLFVKDKRGHSPLNYARREHWGKWTEYLQSRSAILEPVCLNMRKQ
jgi:ankyrin repeat protein